MVVFQPHPPTSLSHSVQRDQARRNSTLDRMATALKRKIMLMPDAMNSWPRYVTRCATRNLNSMKRAINLLLLVKEICNCKETLRCYKNRQAEVKQQDKVMRQFEQWSNLSIKAIKKSKASKSIGFDSVGSYSNTQMIRMPELVLTRQQLLAQ